MRSMGEFLKVCPKKVCISTVGIRKDLFQRDVNKVPITDFFGSVRPVKLVKQITSSFNDSTIAAIRDSKRAPKRVEGNYMYIPPLTY